MQVSKAGGAQQVMYDTVKNGRVQIVVFLVGTLKGLCQLLPKEGLCSGKKHDGLQAARSHFHKEKACLELLLMTITVVISCCLLFCYELIPNE